MTTTVKATGPADFLKLVPLMVGYVPAESIVIVTFAGPRSTGVMRFDLPGGELDLDSVASTIAGLVARVNGADRLAAIVYSSAASASDIRLILTAISRRADQIGLPLIDALYVAADEWGSTMGDATGPLSDIETDDTHGLKPPAKDILSGTELPDVGKGDEVVAALVTLAETIEGMFNGGDAVVSTDAAEAITWLDDLPAFYELALDYVDAELSAWAIASLTWGLARPALRDIALVQWTEDRDAGDRALEAQLAWESGVEYPIDLAQRMWGEGPQPDPKRLEKALALVRLCAGSAPEELQAGPLATAAWLSWALGRSTHAEHYAKLAITSDPEHGLAEIVLSFVSAGHLPDWAFNKPAS